MNQSTCIVLYFVLLLALLGCRKRPDAMLMPRNTLVLGQAGPRAEPLTHDASTKVAVMPRLSQP